MYFEGTLTVLHGLDDNGNGHDFSFFILEEAEKAKGNHQFVFLNL